MITTKNNNNKKSPEREEYEKQYAEFVNFYEMAREAKDYDAMDSYRKRANEALKNYIESTIDKAKEEKKLRDELKDR